MVIIGFKYINYNYSIKMPNRIHRSFRGILRTVRKMTVLRHTLITFLNLSAIWTALGTNPYAVIDLSADSQDFSRYFGPDSGGANGGVKGVPVCGGFDCDGDNINDTAFAQIQASPMGRTRAGEITMIFSNIDCVAPCTSMRVAFGNGTFAIVDVAYLKNPCRYSPS